MGSFKGNVKWSKTTMPVETTACQNSKQAVKPAREAMYSEVEHMEG